VHHLAPVRVQLLIPRQHHLRLKQILNMPSVGLFVQLRLLPPQQPPILLHRRLVANRRLMLQHQLSLIALRL
jgi:hypothetical protein